MSFKRKWVSRLKFAAVCASVIGLFFIVQQIQAKALAAKFHSVQWTWFALAVLIFGALFIPAAARWRIALRASGASVRFVAAALIALIGHFFYTILLGAAGGDTAKSLLYSRWHRVPVTTTLAASSLDRILGLGGLVLFMSIALVLGFSGGGFGEAGKVSLRWSAGWLAGVIVIAAAAIFWLKRSPQDSPQRHFLRTLKAGGRRLLASRADLWSGVACGIAVQAALSGVLALCLAAVSSEPIPWARLAWTFPLISIISALPITFAGLGVRDTAAVTLFSLYHVDPATAVAASLLAAAVSLIWAVAGAALLWWQALRHEMRQPFRSVLAAVPR
ncbi:MAG TPA: lysylphosphatidylglycerol synthase transmembrane domain-containing protein [Verrucomicrobiae bacterium]|nr:lysylphosphatidylglycerol synthase transmembrane domain-containing protein [Verrucomicrobiae bacterium]